MNDTNIKEDEMDRNETGRKIKKTASDLQSQPESEMPVPTEQFYALNSVMICILFSYYVVLMVLGALLFIFQLREVFDIYKNGEISYFSTAVITSIGGALAFSSLYYSRKLYKICIRKRLKKDAEFSEYCGYFLYFLLRPFFAILFTILATGMMLSGIFVVAGAAQYVLNAQFVVLSFVISCCIGFSIGKVLDWFTDNSYKNIKVYTGIN